MAIFIGTAGWSVARQDSDAFPAEGSALERYAAIFPAVEINSSFHRPHRASTWERWRESVPDDFRFSVKVPKQITHLKKLVDCSGELAVFLEEAGHLRHKLAVLLVQLPPKLAFEPQVSDIFFNDLKTRTDTRIACEPRNISWFTPEADRMLREWGISRVAADPAICEAAARPGGDPALSYWRLHGSPVIYRSSYGDRIPFYAEELKAAKGETLCIFDNTASSAATGDALALMDMAYGTSTESTASSASAG